MQNVYTSNCANRLLLLIVRRTCDSSLLIIYIIQISDGKEVDIVNLTFILSYRRPTLVWHKSVNKQLLIKETNINKHLHHKEPLLPYSESDTTRRLYHTQPLIGLRHVEMWPTRKVEEDMIIRSRDQSHVKVDIIMIMPTST